MYWHTFWFWIWNIYIHRNLFIFCTANPSKEEESYKSHFVRRVFPFEVSRGLDRVKGLLSANKNTLYLYEIRSYRYYIPFFTVYHPKSSAPLKPFKLLLIYRFCQVANIPLISLWILNAPLFSAHLMPSTSLRLTSVDTVREPPSRRVAPSNKGASCRLYAQTLPFH